MVKSDSQESDILLNSNSKDMNDTKNIMIQCISSLL